MEVCKGSTASHESDMGLSHTNAISPLCCAGGDLSVIMERSKDVGIRNAKILLLGTFETSNADDAE